MDKDIKRLLTLSRIPNFKLLPEEEQKLEEWKNAQEPLKIKKPRATRKKKSDLSMEIEPNIRLEDLKTTNEVKDNDKTLNEE